MAVRIEMAMPKGCWGCPLVKESITYNADIGGFEPIFRCAISLKKLYKNRRRKDCPLKECE